MSKSKKITFGMIAADMNKEENATVVVAGKNHEYTINVKRSLDIEEAMSFVEGIVMPCVNVDNGRYSPELFDLMVRIGTLVYYAGFDVPDSGEKELSDAYNVLYCTDIFDKVIAVINEDQFQALIHGARETIDHAKNMIVSSQASRLNELLEQMNIMMNDGAAAIEELSDSDVVANISDLLKALEASKNGGTDDAEKTRDNIIELPTQGE